VCRCQRCRRCAIDGVGRCTVDGDGPDICRTGCVKDSHHTPCCAGWQIHRDRVATVVNRNVRVGRQHCVRAVRVCYSGNRYPWQVCRSDDSDVATDVCGLLDADTALPTDSDDGTREIPSFHNIREPAAL
jgi:hypothetical protein